jgi:hypothetical protein
MVRKPSFEKLSAETSTSSRKPNNVCCESDTFILNKYSGQEFASYAENRSVQCITECDLVSDTNKVSNVKRNYLGRNVGKDTA